MPARCRLQLRAPVPESLWSYQYPASSGDHNGWVNLSRAGSTFPSTPSGKSLSVPVPHRWPVPRGPWSKPTSPGPPRKDFGDRTSCPPHTGHSVDPRLTYIHRCVQIPESQSVGWFGSEFHGQNSAVPALFLASA